MDIDDDNPFPEPVEIEITDVFDLHTIQPGDPSMRKRARPLTRFLNCFRCASN
jgi:hypothetical protein